MSSDRLAKLAAKAEARAKILSGETPTTTTSTAASTAVSVAVEASTPLLSPPESAEKQRQDRQARLLAKAEQRMKVVNGEIKLEIKEDSATTSLEQTETGADNRGRWERQWGEKAAQSQAREVPPEFLKKLDVTAEMAVEAPKSIVTAEEELAALRKIQQKLNQGGQTFSLKRLDVASLLTSLALFALGVLSGMTNGQGMDNVWLPFSSLFIFAFFLRLLSVTSLARLGLWQAPLNRRGAAAEEGGWASMMKMALQFLPPPISGAISGALNMVGYVKDANDDMLLFVFAHGLTYNLVKRAFPVNHEHEQPLLDGDFVSFD